MFCVPDMHDAPVFHPVPLSEVRRVGPGSVHHVRVQLRSYEPRRLHQLLKLYCSKCSSMYDSLRLFGSYKPFEPSECSLFMFQTFCSLIILTKYQITTTTLYLTIDAFNLRQDIPDEELLENIFSQASRNPVPCDPPPWALSGTARLPPGPLKRTLSVHVSEQLVCEGKTTQLIFIMGTSWMLLIFIRFRVDYRY